METEEDTIANCPLYCDKENVRKFYYLTRKFRKQKNTYTHQKKIEINLKILKGSQQGIDETSVPKKCVYI